MEQTWNAQLYDERAAIVPRLGAGILDLLAARPNERILDLGCGTGELTARIAESGADVLGVDASSEMLETLRARFPHVRCEQQDGQALAYDGEFDAIFSNAALHWLTRAEETARGMARALRPGGRLVAEFGGSGCVQTVRKAVAAAAAELALPLHGAASWYFPSPVEYGSLLERVGLEPQLLHRFERPTPFPGAHGLRDWLALFAASLLERAGSHHEELCARVEERCRDALFRDGVWMLDYVRLRVIATKPKLGYI